MTNFRIYFPDFVHASSGLIYSALKMIIVVYINNERPHFVG